MSKPLYCGDAQYNWELSNCAVKHCVLKHGKLDIKSKNKKTKYNK